MSYQSTLHPEFVTTVRNWLQDQSEVFVLIRYSTAAGSKDWLFFSSFDEFSEKLSRLPPRSCVTVFHDRQLEMRGEVDGGLIESAQRIISDGTEFLIVNLEPTQYGSYSWFSHANGESSTELMEVLNDRLGRSVAVGPYPDWLYDNDVVVSAIVPESDGSVVIGIY